MSATTFDTLMYAKKLREAGFSEKQAEIQAEALKEIIDNNLATKHDIEKLSNKIEKVELTLTVKFGGMLVIAVGVLAAIIKL
jgi:uncharacterized membrane protein YheB (UPF0754 family)